MRISLESVAGLTIGNGRTMFAERIYSYQFDDDYETETQKKVGDTRWYLTDLNVGNTNYYEAGVDTPGWEPTTGVLVWQTTLFSPGDFFKSPQLERTRNSRDCIGTAKAQLSCPVYLIRTEAWTFELSDTEQSGEDVVDCITVPAGYYIVRRTIDAIHNGAMQLGLAGIRKVENELVWTPLSGSKPISTEVFEGVSAVVDAKAFVGDYLQYRLDPHAAFGLLLLPDAGEPEFTPETPLGWDAMLNAEKRCKHDTRVWQNMGGNVWGLVGEFTVKKLVCTVNLGAIGVEWQYNDSNYLWLPRSYAPIGDHLPAEE
jgi:hypothetical protein